MDKPNFSSRVLTSEIFFNSYKEIFVPLSNNVISSRSIAITLARCTRSMYIIWKINAEKIKQKIRDWWDRCNCWQKIKRKDDHMFNLPLYQLEAFLKTHKILVHLRCKVVWLLLHLIDTLNREECQETVMLWADGCVFRMQKGFKWCKIKHNRTWDLLRAGGHHGSDYNTGNIPSSLCTCVPIITGHQT